MYGMHLHDSNNLQGWGNKFLLCHQGGSNGTMDVKQESGCVAMDDSFRENYYMILG